MRDSSDLLADPTRANRLEQRTSSSESIQPQRGHPMLYTIAVILLVLWLLGLVTSTTMGGFIHVLIVIALVMVLLRIIQGRKIL
jgi:hypothetical protein